MPFVVDELKDLSVGNATALLDLLARNNITLVSAFPTSTPTWRHFSVATTRSCPADTGHRKTRGRRKRSCLKRSSHRLLQGQFICEASAPSLLFGSSTPSSTGNGVEPVPCADQSALVRDAQWPSLLRHPGCVSARSARGGQARHGQHQAGVAPSREVSRPLHGLPRHRRTPSPRIASTIPAMLQRITENPHLLEQLREFSLFGKNTPPQPLRPACSPR